MDEVALDIQGTCRQCIYVDLEEEVLKQYREKFLERYNQELRLIPDKVQKRIPKMRCVFCYHYVLVVRRMVHLHPDEDTGGNCHSNPKNQVNGCSRNRESK